MTEQKKNTNSNSFEIFSSNDQINTTNNYTNPSSYNIKLICAKVQTNEPPILAKIISLIQNNESTESSSNQLYKIEDILDPPVSYIIDRKDFKILQNNRTQIQAKVLAVFQIPQFFTRQL
jgi:hypothetical protein